MVDLDLAHRDAGKRLHAAADSDNYASQSLLRSAGFRQWGADHKAWRRSDGTLSDGVYFELLADSPDLVVGGKTDRRSAVGGRTDRRSPWDERGLSSAPGFEPITLEGNGMALANIFGHLDTFMGGFPIVEP